MSVDDRGSGSGISRREWIAVNGSVLCALIAAAIPGCANRDKRRPTIVLCSGWQTANIGDIAHTPGLIQLLQKHLPEHNIIFWPKQTLDRGADEMLRRHFPAVEIVEGTWDDEETKRKVSRADFLLHGSGPAVQVRERLDAWSRELGRPFGIFGVTVSSVEESLRELLQQAEFVYTRESYSLRNIREAGVTKPVTGFAPDATFAMSIRDDARADEFMQVHDLQPGKFICAVPRLRKTPYYKIYPEDKYSPEQIAAVDRLNAGHAEIDHAKLREAMIRWVRETFGKVAVVPEMTYQLDIMDELLYRPLPEDVKKNVVLRDTYWLPDEAASLYARARAVLSFECHSPIISVNQGTPALYLRQPEDTIKGQMWYDLRFDDWVVEIEESSGEQIADILMNIQMNTDKSNEYLRQAMINAKEYHSTAMKQVRQCI